MKDHTVLVAWERAAMPPMAHAERAGKGKRAGISCDDAESSDAGRGWHHSRGWAVLGLQASIGGPHIGRRAGEVAGELLRLESCQETPLKGVVETGAEGLSWSDDL